VQELLLINITNLNRAVCRQNATLELNSSKPPMGILHSPNSGSIEPSSSTILQMLYLSRKKCSTLPSKINY